ncbi:flagellar assembly factor FliW [Spirochaetota bacterium]|nr:flagellar assembly factor FliW [Spirochaetota bacterium]
MTMTLATKKLGTVTYTQADIIHFPEGLLGFETIKHYLLIKDNYHKLLYFLQAISEPDLCFILVYPCDLFPNYKIESDFSYPYTHHFAIVTHRELEAQTTVNLLGPIIIHKKNQTGWQIISSNNAFSTRHIIDIKNHAKSDQKPLLKLTSSQPLVSSLTP